MPRGPQGFPRAARLRSSLDFQRLLRQGRRTSRGKLLALWIMSGDAAARLGVTASRKVGGAVVRNRAKRWIREWFRKTSATLPRGLSLVVIVRPGAVEAGHPAFLRDLLALERGLMGASP